MKHIALFLAVVIFALSLVSCGNLNYFYGSEWKYTAEEFYNGPFDKVKEKIVEISKECGLDLYNFTSRTDDSNAAIWLSDEQATFVFRFRCDNYWCSIETEMFFFGNGEEDLLNYDAQKTYIDFANKVTHTLVYDADPNLNAYKHSFDYCVENNESSYDGEKHYDALLGDLTYGVKVKVENYGYRKNLNGNLEFDAKCNIYHLEGLLSGEFVDSLA